MDTYIWNRSARLREIEEPKRDQTCRDRDEVRAERDQAHVVLSAAGTWHRQVQGKFLREALARVYRVRAGMAPERHFPL